MLGVGASRTSSKNMLDWALRFLLYFWVCGMFPSMFALFIVSKLLVAV